MPDSGDAFNTHVTLHVTAEAQLPVKKTRVGKPKVKTGCTTCKIRRVKCDEVKPHCQKCTSTGRRCDGYATRADNLVLSPSVAVTLKDPFTPNPWNQLLNFQGTDLENRYLCFFRRYTAPILSGCFDPHFWNGLVLQVGHSEPTIQHAMVAVACVHEQLEGVDRSLLDGVENGRNSTKIRCFAIEQYNKAINCLKARLSEAPQSEEVILLCCVLFICLEFMRGNIDTAICHLHSGLDIMREWQARASQVLPRETKNQSSTCPSVPDNLCQIFSRLTLQSMLCGRVSPYPLSQVSSTDEPLNFTSLQAARVILDELVIHSVQSLRDATLWKLHPPETQEQLIESVRALHIALEKWFFAFNIFIKRNSKTFTGQEAHAATTLQILNIIAKIWLPSVLADGELAFDSQASAFSQVVELASTLSTNQAPNIATPSTCHSLPSKSPEVFRTFTFEMGIIAPLYFVAIKCRIPSIRRAAVDLLRTTMPRREGVWIASMVAAIAQRVIEIEEEDLETIGTMDDVWGELRPPEWRRVCDAIIVSRAEAETLDRIQKVTFVVQLDIVDGTTRLQEEEVRWNAD